MTGYESRDLINKLNTPCPAVEGNTWQQMFALVSNPDPETASAPIS